MPFHDFRVVATSLCPLIVTMGRHALQIVWRPLFVVDVPTLPLKGAKNGTLPSSKRRGHDIAPNLLVVACCGLYVRFS